MAKVSFGGEGVRGGIDKTKFVELYGLCRSLKSLGTARGRRLSPSRSRCDVAFVLPPGTFVGKGLINIWCGGERRNSAEYGSGQIDFLLKESR